MDLKEKSQALFISKLRNFTVYTVCILCVLIPIFVLPITAEFYEFNRSFLLLVAVLMIAVIAAIKLAFTGGFSIVRSNYDLWMGLVFISSFLSLIFGKHFLTGLLGYSGRLSEGFLVLVGLMLVSLVIRKVALSKDILSKIIFALLIGGALAGFVTIMHFMGIYVLSIIPGFGFTAIRNFAVIGAQPVMKLFFLILTPISLAAFLATSRDVKKSLINLPITILIFGGFVISVGNFWNWTGVVLWLLFIGSIMFVISGGKQLLRSATPYLITIFAFCCVFFILRNIDSVSNSLTKDDYSNQPVLQYDISWSIASGSIAENPIRGLIGNGPDSFAYSFAKYRPISYNESDNWNVRFSRASNQIFEIMSNFGVLGLVVWVGLFSVIIMSIYKSSSENHAYPYNFYISGLNAAMGIIVFSSLFFYFNISIWFLFWVILGLIIAGRTLSVPRLCERVNFSLLVSKEKIAVEDNNILPYVVLVPVITFSLFGFYSLSRMYLGEIHYRSAQVSMNNIELKPEKTLDYLTDSYNSLERSIKSFPYKSDYFRDKAIVATQILEQLALVPPEDIENYKYETEQKVMVQQAIDSSSQAINLNSVDVRNWESRFVVYRNLLKYTTTDFTDSAIKAVQEAILRDPVKPQLYRQYGVILSLIGANEQSLDQFKKAVELQPRILDVRYDLAMQFEKMGMITEAKNQLQSLLKLLREADLEGSEIYRQVEDKLQLLEKSLGSDIESSDPETDSEEDLEIDNAQPSDQEDSSEPVIFLDESDFE